MPLVIPASQSFLVAITLSPIAKFRRSRPASITPLGSRSEEPTSELQSLLINTYSHPCLLLTALPICPQDADLGRHRSPHRVLRDKHPRGLGTRKLHDSLCNRHAPRYS